MTDTTRRDDTPDFERMSDEDLAQEIIDLEEDIASISDQLADDLQGIGEREPGWSMRAATVRNYKRSYLRFALREKAARIADNERIEKETIKRDSELTRRESIALEVARKEAAVAEKAAAAAWLEARKQEAVLPKSKKKAGVEG